MYYSISGIAQVKENFVVVYAGGVGYRIYTSNQTAALIKNSQEVTLYTYLNVKEDLMQLFGFYTEEELGYFQMLINVSGVGPKGALAILSVLSPAELAMSIVTQDAKAITVAHGVGKKLAEKIIVELKDKFKGVDINDVVGDVRTQSYISNDTTTEAVNALMVLGYSSVDAKRAVSMACTEADTLEEIIKISLKKLSAF